MNEFCISSYLIIMGKSLDCANVQVKVGTTFLNSIANREDVLVDFDDKLVSLYISRGRDVHEAIRSKLNNENVIEDIKKYFVDTVSPRIIEKLVDDSCEELLKVMEKDKSISRASYKKYKSIYENDMSDKKIDFYSESFIYALCRPNEIVGDIINENDFILLTETNEKCPICHKELIEYLKNTQIKKYKVIDLNTLQPIDEKKKNKRKKVEVSFAKDKLILCNECADRETLNPQKNEIEKLKQIKNDLMLEHSTRIDIMNMPLSNDIYNVIIELYKKTDIKNLCKTKYNAVNLKKKLRKPLTINIQKEYVLPYYKMIQKMFCSLEGGEAKYRYIQSNIRSLYDRLALEDYTQEIIIDKMSQLIFDKICKEQKYMECCKILVAYFIQSCEVFDEITK